MSSNEARAALYHSLQPSVVKIWVYNSEFERYVWKGAGVFVDQRGYVLTVCHFLDGEDSPLVKIGCSNGREYANVLIVNKNVKCGLVILKVEEQEEETSDFACYALVSEKKIKFGEEVYCIGHPCYMDYSCLIGQVAHPRRKCSKLLEIKMRKIQRRHEEAEKAGEFKVVRKLSEKLKFVQFNNIHGDSLGGASGSPVFNSEGKMIAMYLLEMNNLAFGIHAKEIRSFIDRAHAERIPSFIDRVQAEKTGKKRSKLRGAARR